MAVVKVIGIGETAIRIVNEIYLNKSIAGISSFILVNSRREVVEILPDNTLLKYGIGKGQEMDIKGLDKSDMVFIVTAMDDRISSGLVNWIAASASSSGALVIGLPAVIPDLQEIVTDSPFFWGIHEFQTRVSLFIPVTLDISINESGDSVVEDKNGSVLYDTIHIIIKSIVEMIEKPGIINVVFPEVKAVINQGHTARVISLCASGENTISTILKKLKSTPNCADTFPTVVGVLINITGGTDLSVSDLSEILEMLEGLLEDDTPTVFNGIIDDYMEESIRVTIIAITAH